MRNPIQRLSIYLCNHHSYMQLQNRNRRLLLNASLQQPMYYGFQQVLKGANLLYYNRTDTQDAYLDTIINLAEKGLNINRLLKNKAKMKLGLQPDARYDVRHL